MTIYHNLGKFRELAIQCDLTPDKSYSVKGNVIRYVSIDKYRRVLAPVFVRAGIDFSFSIVEVVDLPLTARVTVDFRFTHIETGQTVTDTIIADGSNTDPVKAIPIALSYAMRMLLSNRFMLSDGIDFSEPTESVDDALDRVSIPQYAPVTDVKAQTVTVPVKPVEKEIPVEPVKAEESVENPVKTDDDAEKVSAVAPVEDKPVKVCNLAPMEKSAAVKCMKVIEEGYKNGKVVEDTYLDAKKIFENLSCTADVTALMGIKSQIPNDKVKEGF